MNTTTTNDAEQTPVGEVFRAVHRGSLQTLGVGTAAELLSLDIGTGARWDDVALYRTVEGPLGGLVHVGDTHEFLTLRAASDRGVKWDVVGVNELREGDLCLTRDGREVAFRSQEFHGFEGGNAKEVCGVGTLALRLREPLPNEPVGHLDVMAAAAIDRRTPPAAREHALRVLMGSPEGRTRIMRVRAQLAGVALAAFAAGSDTFQLAVRNVADFDGLTHIAAGVAKSSGRVRSRGTGEEAEVLAWDRDTLGVPMLSVRWAESGLTGILYLYDAEGIA
jgi:hypothetical protein